MVIDSSAVLAILQNEPERRAFNEAIAAAETRLLSAASLVELSIVLEARFGPDGQGDLDLFLSTAQIEIVALDRDQAELARSAFSRYGKGRHRAGLNFGDCFSYALAQWAGAPLLFKGDDFIHTDLEPAWTPVGFSGQE
ncbi:type II toxin-antitoxin system VapC family toxin [Cyanobium sp. ATX 6A2]|uniref:type II toxin-antitoxin system VapC family toxin n=1 Tax=Cyanobium sp. ATX 6A2 TaxID=2823700 RepID=UPI0020CCDEF3|nr:type II toxin-antitoxin system VapC family toxin [Cyanobium sp. ATX 6A2]MCP9888020.1 type II toxin-antitoxin system VapC family toxin [Cyanobium sp. ATX 6A2]